MATKSERASSPDAAQPPGPGRFEEIYDANVVPIYRFIYARVGNAPDAEDLTAQVFMRAVEQLDTTRQNAQIVSWLYRVSQNAIADYWRAFYRLPVIGTDQVAPGWEPADTTEPAPASGGAQGSAAAGEERAKRQVASLLRRLPANYRRVLELRFIQRLTVAETADRMGITRSNAKVLQYRALRKAALVGEGADG
ncbi:MAG: sigma-70 family RNA polymerase sigma factor [Chloroflexi bacterium]|nr:MAG: sigma-70 family RNA polymerase sigma factor [Chloroflexota bacterium]